MIQKIVLVGYMGSGKTLIGKLLSEKIGLSFLDLDDLIEKDENCAIKNIFETKGEIYFRQKEHHLFKVLMQNDESFIISLGGGTPCYANNHEFLTGDFIVSIYLKASIKTLYSRLKNEIESRPLLAKKTDDELQEFIAKHLFERSFYYNKCRVIINVDSKFPKEIVREIEKTLS